MNLSSQHGPCGCPLGPHALYSQCGPHVFLCAQHAFVGNVGLEAPHVFLYDAGSFGLALNEHGGVLLSLTHGSGEAGLTSVFASLANLGEFVCMGLSHTRALLLLGTTQATRSMHGL